MPGSVAHAQVVLDNHFDDENLATNTLGVGGGFVENKSGGTSSGFASESGTTVSITEQSSAAEGVASINSANLAGGATVRWDVASYAHTGSGLRRTFFGLQGANNEWLFGGSLHPAIVVELDPVADTARLRLNAPDGSETVEATQSFANLLITDADGFVLDALLTPTGYEITSTGLDTTGAEEVALSGAWDATGPFSFASLFGTENLFTSAYVQNVPAASTGTLQIDRIIVNAALVPEASSIYLWGLLGLLGLAAHVRRRTR